MAFYYAMFLAKINSTDCAVHPFTNIKINYVSNINIIIEFKFNTHITVIYFSMPRYT